MAESSPRRSRLLRNMYADDIVYGVIGAVLLSGAVARVIAGGAAVLDVAGVVLSALLVGAALRGRGRPSRETENVAPSGPSSALRTRMGAQRPPEKQ